MYYVVLIANPNELAESNFNPAKHKIFSSGNLLFKIPLDS